MTMLQKVAMSMLANSTTPGRCPTRLSTLLASVLAMLCLLSAPAMAKPPSSSMITCRAATQQPEASSCLKLSSAISALLPMSLVIVVTAFLHCCSTLQLKHATNLIACQLLGW